MTSDTQPPLDSPSLISETEESPTPGSSDGRRRRSRVRKAGRRHRDLTPEEDNRRRQRRIIVLNIVPGILAVLGGLVWIAGAWNMDEYQHQKKMVLTGQAFLLGGGGFFALLLLRQWGLKLLREIKERRNPPLDTSLHNHRHHHGHRSKRRRHRSARPSAFRPE